MDKWPQYRNITIIEMDKFRKMIVSIYYITSIKRRGVTGNDIYAC